MYVEQKDKWKSAIANILHYEGPKGFTIVIKLNRMQISSIIKFHEGERKISEVSGWMTISF